MSTRPTIAVDEQHGHVTIRQAGVYPNELVAVIQDDGDICRLLPGPVGSYRWTIRLTEDQARVLGVALIEWAGRKRLARKETQE